MDEHLEKGVLFIYGEEEEPIYENLLAWVEIDPERSIVFLGKGMEFLWSKARALLDHPRIFFYDLSLQSTALEKIAWDYVFTPYEYLISSLADRTEAKQVFAKLQALQAEAYFIASDAQDKGVKKWEHLLANLPYLASARPALSLKGKCAGIPALILGASPSLHKSLPQLQKLTGKALIFAAGSALYPLSQAGITPHFCAAVDPDAAPNLPIQVPLLYQNQVHPSFLSRAQGPLLWVPASSGYTLENWLNENLGVHEEWDGGWNVATFCTALAVFFGCNPIFFVGMDLCYWGDKKYAEGVPPSSASQDTAYKKVVLKEEKGKVLYSQEDWVVAAGWLGRFAEQHKECSFIHVTEEGLPLVGTFRKSPEKLTEELLKGKEERNLYAFIQKLLEQTPPLGKSYAQKAQWLINELQYSMLYAQDFCEQILEEIERLHVQSSSKESSEKDSLFSGEIALLDVELQEEIITQQLLLPLWKIWGPQLSKEANRDLQKKGRIAPPILNDPLYLHRILFYLKTLMEYIPSKEKYGG